MAQGRKRGRPRYDDALTPAEWRTVHAAQHGMTNREIAKRRGISVDAVKFHISNALGKLGLERKAELRHWFAVPAGSPLNREGTAMNALSLGPVGQISRSVEDLPKAEAWYRDVLGLLHLYTFGNLAFFDCGGVRLFLSQEKRGPSAESIIYFRVDDIKSAYEILNARGVEFTSPPHMIHRHTNGTEEWMAFFKDPEGRPLAIMAQIERK